MVHAQSEERIVLNVLYSKTHNNKTCQLGTGEFGLTAIITLVT